MNRRSFLFGAGALAAPAIIRPGILMPVSVWRRRWPGCVILGTTGWGHGGISKAWPPPWFNELYDKEVLGRMRELLLTGETIVGDQRFLLNEDRPFRPPVDAPEQTCA